MARFAAAGPFEGTRRRLLHATGAAAVIIAAAAVFAGVVRGFDGGLDLVLGALVVLVPAFWVALSLTARRSAGGAVLMGLARYTAAVVGFALLFALRPSSSPGMVLLGSILALLIPPIVLVWQQRPSK
ncbi:hypothetical protein N9M28_06225 [Luminiphilus sp.]|nr:hypothetical protein [Luminiphilus sp.]